MRRVDKGSINTFFELSTIASIMVTLEGGFIIRANDRFANLLGYKPNELIGSKFTEKITIDRGKGRDIISRLREAGFVRDEEVTVSKDEGNEYTMLLSAELVYMDDQACALAMFNDITKLRQAEKALIDSERKYRDLVRLAPTGIYEVDFRTDSFISVNDNICLRLGYTREELLKMRTSNLMDEEDRLKLRSRTGQWLLGEKPTGKVEYRLKGKDGRVIYAELEVSFTRDELGQPLGATGIVHDITERKINEEALKEANTLLEARNAELDAFNYSASHDLRAPLRVISSFCQILKSEYSVVLDETGRSYLERIINASNRMAQIVDDLLNLSRVTRAEIKPGTVDLSEIACSIAYEMQQNEPDRNAEFEISDGICVYADRGLMNIVIDNLISNAWKFTSVRENARIEFSSSRDENGRTVCVMRDNGVGFDMAYAERLFVPFHRLHSESDFPGTGIGLAIVRRIIERHGGSAWIEARENEGAAFYFILPDNNKDSNN